MSVSVALSAWIVLPAPTRMLLPFGVAMPELAPWLVVFNLVVIALVAAFYGMAALFMLVPLAASLVPLTQVSGVLRDMEEQHLWGADTPATIIRDTFHAGGISELAPEKLPLGILFYRPKSNGPRPILVDIYGGAWQRGSPADDQTFHRYLASVGYAVFAIDYRHAPEFKYPAQLEDVRAALAFIAGHASEYNADAKRIAICGHSSGAQLAMLAAYTSDAPRIRAVISYYGPTNLAGGYADPPTPDPLRVRGVLENYLGGSPAQIADRYRAASPLKYADRQQPPTLLIQGQRDHIVKPNFADELQRNLISSGNRAYVLQLPWSEHAFDAIFFGLGNQIAVRCIERFLSEALQE